MSFDPVTALIAYHTALDSQDLAGVAKLLADEVRYVSAGLGDVKGRDTVLAAMGAYFSASPDHQAFDDEVRQVAPNIAECRWRLTATNKTTGLVTERRGTETVTFDGDGKIISILVEDQV